jgi:membrane fusion protein, multidrug efflux system
VLLAPSASAADAPVPIVAGTVEQGDFPLHLDGIGTVQAYNTVQIKSRIDGQLVELRFREGQDVAVGDVLAVLDRRPLEANLKQAQANLQKDQAQLANAKADLARFQGLKEYASRQSVDTQQASVAQFQAQAASDEAQVDYARTQLDYAVITSPIAGRTGIRQIDLGNILHAADATPIVTVTQLRPISVIFTLNADDLPAIDQSQKLPVSVYAKDNRTELAQGTLDLVDNQIDQATGTVKLKASFANTDGRLWPGQFVNARLGIGVRQDALSVPASAVQQGPSGPYVWAVTPEGTAAMAPVAVARVEDGRALIDHGLAAGQTIVLDGQYNLKPGSPVARAPPPASEVPPS